MSIFTLRLNAFNAQLTNCSFVQIVEAVKEAGIQAKTYTVNLSLPIAVHFRAHFIWYKLLNVSQVKNPFN